MNKLILLLILFPITAQASISFNGINQNIFQSSGFTLGLSNQKKLTMSAWVDITGAGGAQDKVFGKSTAAGGNQTFNFGAQDCGLLNGSSATNTLCLSMGIDNNSQNTFIVDAMTSSSFPLLGKHFVAVVWNNTAGNATDFVFYINGVSQNSSLLTNVGNGYSTSTVIEDLSSTLYLGSACGDTCPSEFLPGSIADAAVWLTNLTSGNITTLYNGGAYAPCLRIPMTIGSPIMYFPLNDSSTGSVGTYPINYGSAAFTLNSQANGPTWSSDMGCSSSVVSGNIVSGNINY